jgi:hypothetical protein
VRTLLSISAILLLFLGSCLKEKEFPVEPFIEFKGFTKVFIPPDTIPAELILSIRFTDGDGDIGLSEADSLPPYVDPYNNNFFIDLVKFVHGQPEITEINYNSRIPLLDENLAERPMEGLLEYTFDQNEYGIMRDFLLNDTIAFDVSIIDRALNHSNVIRTPYMIIE